MSVSGDWFFGMNQSTKYFIWKQEEINWKIFLISVPGSADFAYEIQVLQLEKQMVKILIENMTLKRNVLQKNIRNLTSILQCHKADLVKAIVHPLN